MTWITFSLICSLFISISALLQKKILFREHAIEFCFVVALYNVVITAPFLINADFSNFRLFPVVLIILSGVLSATSFLLSAKAVRHMEVSVASPLFASVPVITALLAFFILGERLSYVQNIGIGLVAIGCYLIQVQPGREHKQEWRALFGSKYLHFLMMAALIYGTTSILDRVILSWSGIEPLVYVPLLNIVILATTVIIIKVFYVDKSIIPRGFDNHSLWILAVALLTIGYRFAQMEALQTGYTGLVIAIKYSSVLLTTIIGVELFKEGGLFRKIFASFVILAGVILVAI